MGTIRREQQLRRIRCRIKNRIAGAKPAQRQRQLRRPDHQRRRRRRGKGRHLGFKTAKGLEQQWGGQIAAKGPRYRGAIRPPQPDPDHLPPIPANGPGIPVAIGGAGFIGKHPSPRPRWRCQPAQDIAQMPGSLLGQQPGQRAAGNGLITAQGNPLPPRRNPRIDLHQILQ